MKQHGKRLDIKFKKQNTNLYVANNYTEVKQCIRLAQGWKLAFKMKIVGLREWDGG